MHQLADRHSLSILHRIQEYESFLENIKTVCDMGCGTGEDIHWWATLENYDDPPEPYNFKCFAVDKDPGKLAQVPAHPNIVKVERDFTKQYILPVKMDLMWAHDSLQYSTNPLETLKFWNEAMNVNAMLLITVPQHTGVEYNKFTSRTHQGCFFQYTPASLIYMLAINGFDCNDAYLYKQYQDPWIQMAVYKSDIAPMDPVTTTWADLIEKNLLNPSVVRSVTNHGYIRQEEILYPWLDKENYFIDWVPQYTVIPEEAGEPIETGIFNTTTASDKQSLVQADPKTKVTNKVKPVGIMRPPKQSYKT